MASIKNEYEHRAVGHSSNWWRGMDRTVGLKVLVDLGRVCVQLTTRNVTLVLNIAYM